MSALLLWYLEGTYSVVSVKSIVSPVKESAEYRIEEDVEARYGGKTYPAKIVKISENRKELESAMKELVSKAHIQFTFQRKDTGEPLPKRKLSVESSVESSVDEEVKQSKEEKKRQKDRLKQRQETLKTVTQDVVVGSHSQQESSEKAIVDMLLRIEKREKVEVDAYSNAVETVLGCRNCLKKVYRKIDHPQQVVVSDPVWVEKSLNGSSLSPAVPETSSAVPETSSKNENVVLNDSQPPPDQVLHQENEQPVVKDKVKSTCSDDDLIYLGDARFSIRLAREVISRCEKTSKSAEKLALNLIEFILTKEEIETSTVYGNVQHGKAAMNVNKREALKSHVFSMYPQDCGKWGKIVISLNDKIRKLRKGVYKDRIL